MVEQVYLNLKQAAESVGPRWGDKPTSPETIRRWCLTGLRGVMLKSVERAGLRYTTAGWLKAFWAAVGREKEAAKTAVKKRLPPGARSGQSRQRKARQRLEEQGAR